MKKGEFSIIIVLLIVALLLSTASIIITSTNTGLTGSTIGEVNANITGLIAFTISPDSIDFGNIILGGSNDTVTDGISPFIITNTGNAKLDITVNSSAPLLTGTSAVYQFNSSCSESDCAVTVYDSWIDFTQSSQDLVKAFEFNNAKDALRVDLKIGVPLDEPAGAKSDTLTFTASEASGGGGDYATGGTITEVGGYRIHTFTSNGTFEVIGGPLNVDVLVVAGGGGGGSERHGAGGGAGGLLYNSSYSIVAGSYDVTIGEGGAGGVGSGDTGYAGMSGSNSSFEELIAIGGGGGGAFNHYGDPVAYAKNGGSGGGAGVWDATPGLGTSGQGHDGGNYEWSECYPNGGGGGAGSVGSTGTGFFSGDGGVGLEYGINGSNVYYAGGGGAAISCPSGTPGAGGIGGGGAGSKGIGTNGTANTGGGGGGSERADGDNLQGASGGSGIVIVRYLI